MNRAAVASMSFVVALAACSGSGRVGPGPAAGASTGSSVGAPSPAAGSPPSVLSSAPHFSHVAIVVMENKEYDRVISNRDAPFVNGLARRYGLATSFFAESHPSLPNYLALIGGSTFGIHSDCTDCHVSSSNLIDQLEQAGISWKAYMEGMPSPCFTGAAAGPYVKKHDPFLYFDDIAGDPARCSKVVPLSVLDRDIAAGTLPQFVWISPGLCHDMHDCSVAEGDRYLSGLVPRLLSAMGRNGVLFLTWDEGSTDRACCGGPGGGHVPTIVAGRLIAPGTRFAVTFTHYSILRTIEGNWDLAPLRQAGCTCTEPMTAFFAGT